MTKFEALGLSPDLLRALKEAGLHDPTPIQSAAIPAICEGRDFLGIAETGTGKTAAFVLPLLARIQGRSRANRRTCHALILAPTRELALQLKKSLAIYGAFTRHTSALVVGGMRIGPQKQVLMQGVDIVVATPGRLEDLMSSEALSLDQTTTLVLDEADQMLDMGFSPAIQRIASACATASDGSLRQTVLLSATMPPGIQKLAQDLLKDPVKVSMNQDSKPAESIMQRLISVDKSKKLATLVSIVSESAVIRAIVFTRTRISADKTAKHLVTSGLKADSLHGEKSQRHRERIMRNFRSGRLTILVATDVAARGLDIPEVSHVINLELPVVAEAYVHRIGRTGRAGKTGQAISLYDPSEKNLLHAIERFIGVRFDKNGHPHPHSHTDMRKRVPHDGKGSGKTSYRKNKDQKKTARDSIKTVPKHLETRSDHKAPFPIDGPLEGTGLKTSKKRKTYQKAGGLPSQVRPMSKKKPGKRPVVTSGPMNPTKRVSDTRPSHAKQAMDLGKQTIKRTAQRSEKKPERHANHEQSSKGVKKQTHQATLPKRDGSTRRILRRRSPAHT